MLGYYDAAMILLLYILVCKWRTLLDVGCIAIGTEAECRKYIGRKIGGLQLSCNKLYNTKGAGQ